MNCCLLGVGNRSYFASFSWTRDVTVCTSKSLMLSSVLGMNIIIFTPHLQTSFILTILCDYIVQYDESAVELAYSYQHNDIVVLLMSSRDKVSAVVVHCFF